MGSMRSTRTTKAGGSDIPGHKDQNGGPIFACPFYKYDSMRYMSCAALRLLRIRDVKQHLNRRHYRPGHSVGYGFVSEDARRRDSHLRNSPCRLPPGHVAVEGVTESQRTALARRSNPALNNESQWFIIWHILFPDRPPPFSPYLLAGTGSGGVLNFMQDYWEGHRETLVAEAVQSVSGCTDTGDDSNNSSTQRVTELSTRVVNNLFSRLRERSQTITGTSSPDPPDSSLTTTPAAPTPPMHIPPSPFSWNASEVPGFADTSDLSMAIAPSTTPFPFANFSSTASEASAPLSSMFYRPELPAPSYALAPTQPETPDVVSANLAHMGGWSYVSSYPVHDSMVHAPIVPVHSQVQTPWVVPTTYLPVPVDMPYYEYTPEDRGVDI